MHSFIVAYINVPQPKVLSLPENRVLGIEQRDHLFQVINIILVSTNNQSAELTVPIAHYILDKRLQLAHLIKLNIQRIEALVIQWQVRNHLP